MTARRDRAEEVLAIVDEVDRAEDEHDVTVHYDRSRGYQARCSCTWHGAWHRGGHTAADDAGSDADDHEDEHEPATGSIDDYTPIGWIEGDPAPWSQPDAWPPLDDLRRAREHDR